MNLFSEYQIKIYKSLKILERRKKIIIPSKIESFSVELPPKNKHADISCNAAMILAKINKTSPIHLADTIKKHLLINFKEFETIEVAHPGFLNISFKNEFWKEFLREVIKLNYTYGSSKKKRKSIMLNLYLQILQGLYTLDIAEVLF